MLNLISTADAAANTCASGAAVVPMPMRRRQATGALPFGGGMADLRVRAAGSQAHESAISGPVAGDPVTVPWPRAISRAEFSGHGIQAAGQALGARHQRTMNKFAHTTRIAAAGGGALGPHPAREPV